MIELSKLTLAIAPMVCDFIPGSTVNLDIKNKYAQSIPYEELYHLEEKRNKKTMEYNYRTTDELVKEQNEKILKEIFLKQEN